MTWQNKQWTANEKMRKCISERLMGVEKNMKKLALNLGDKKGRQQRRLYGEKAYSIFSLISLL